MSTVSFRGKDWDIKLDPDGMSFEEMEEMETALEMAWGLIESKSSGKDTSMKVIRAMIWISLKRQIPDLPFEDTRSIKMSDLKNLAGDASPLASTPGSTSPSDSPGRTTERPSPITSGSVLGSGTSSPPATSAG